MAPKWTMHSKTAHQTTIPFEAIPMKYYQLVRWLSVYHFSTPRFFYNALPTRAMQHQVIITIIIVRWLLALTPSSWPSFAFFGHPFFLSSHRTPLHSELESVNNRQPSSSARSSDLSNYVSRYPSLMLLLLQLTMYFRRFSHFHLYKFVAGEAGGGRHCISSHSQQCVLGRTESSVGKECSVCALLPTCT